MLVFLATPKLGKSKRSGDILLQGKNKQEINSLKLYNGSIFLTKYSYIFNTTYFKIIYDTILLLCFTCIRVSISTILQYYLLPSNLFKWILHTEKKKDSILICSSLLLCYNVKLILLLLSSYGKLYYNSIYPNEKETSRLILNPFYASNCSIINHSISFFSLLLYYVYHTILLIIHGQLLLLIYTNVMSINNING